MKVKDLMNEYVLMAVIALIFFQSCCLLSMTFRVVPKLWKITT